MRSYSTGSRRMGIAIGAICGVLAASAAFAVLAWGDDVHEDPATVSEAGDAFLPLGDDPGPEGLGTIEAAPACGPSDDPGNQDAGVEDAAITDGGAGSPWVEGSRSEDSGVEAMVCAVPVPCRADQVGAEGHDYACAEIGSADDHGCSVATLEPIPLPETIPDGGAAGEATMKPVPAAEGR